jgi:5-methylcytosine-specific restriction endonuclease McrA
VALPPMTPQMDERTGRVVAPLESFPIVDQIEFAQEAARPRPPQRWREVAGVAWLPRRAYYEWYATRGRDPDSRRRNKLPTWLVADVIDRDGNLCGLCGDPVEEPPHIDHIHPWAHGGKDELNNLQVAHPKCNIAKGARVA